MVQIAGKYELVDSKNFLKVLLSGGIPEDKAKLAENITTVLDVTIDGNKVRLQSDEKLNNHVTELILGQEVDEKFSSYTLKTIAKLDGNVINVESKEDGKPTRTRIYRFTDSGLEIEYNSVKDNYTAKRVYKRI
ncbi:hypothetical protein NQ318_021322 [Aromia moschata]|uniref:Uncharacterized protein n=1 Tax=Aromia moschata TaxID=1265417 RepID=A0AAV8ZET8_9CUCU|nr:hypothetical protein NQ318_021322 [Aromia moschata]